MGQEQSYAHASATQIRRYKEKHFESPLEYRHSAIEFRTKEYDSDYKRHKIRRSGDSFKSDNTESSGYRSGSNSAYEYRSTAGSDYCRLSLYKNDHYKDVNKELYKPVKIPKEKRYKLQLLDLDDDDIRSARINSYLSDTEKTNSIAPSKKAGIRNYTPKILSEEEQKKQNWV